MKTTAITFQLGQSLLTVSDVEAAFADGDFSAVDWKGMSAV